jgi:predicted MFS family arabinose efflux permease
MTAGRRTAIATALGGLVALAAAMGIGRFVYTPILPDMIASLGLTKSQAGLIASANFLGYLVGAFAAAAPLPGGRRRWFLGALAASALSTGAMALGDSVAPFLFLRFLGGVASAFVLILASSLVLDRLAMAGQPGLAAVHFAGVGSGIALSAVIVAALAAGGHHWQAQWLASGAVSLLALAAAAWLLPGDGAAAQATMAAARTAIDPRLIRLTVAYGLFGFGYVITATFIAAMVREAAALRDIEGIVWLVVGLAAMPSVALWAWVGRRLGNGAGFALACVVEAIGVAASVAETPATVLLCAVLLGGTIMGITALGFAAGRELIGGDPRRLFAVMTGTFGIGQMIGPSFAGLAYEMSGSFTLPTLAAAAALLLAAALTARPSVRRG